MSSKRNAVAEILGKMESPVLMVSENARGCYNCGEEEHIQGICSSCQYAYLWDSPNRDSPHLVREISSVDDLSAEEIEHIYSHMCNF